MSTIRVVVADDDETMRRAMIDVLEAHGGFSVVADVATGAGLPELVAETDAELVVLDVRMPSGGASAARALRASAPYPTVVAVSASNDVSTVAEMVRAGATGFLAKGHLGTTFADDLVRCTRGHVMIAVPQGVQVLRAIGERPPDGPADLTAVEAST
ncbi:MAG TPA: response regulator [Nocardioides sp.]|uniref:response regulator n=1 Tax=Nocardioides sp. TaxID=35761 RepID=UPI002F3FFE49